VLRRDWETLVSEIVEHGGDAVTGHAGVALQVRPKAARGGALRRSFDANGAPQMTRPSGLYLRATFTARVLAAR
jgi:DNA mismatch repair protein MutH